ncbi:MAG TPA: monovalent cation/H(+) antiporter subunit G [Dehalococcoidia bacterium]|jgi:multicomponent Na+:H+ antiporter subunit G|nr:monovalent cation/H(+) antiporter subunit G [Dehalococcoidia bacterium]
MTLVQIILAVILMLGGAFFLTVSALGLLRLPDFYARTHAVGKSETLGTILTLFGLAVYNGWGLSTFKILFIIFFVLIASPTATHAIARAALRTGLEPWTRKKQTGEDTKDKKS